MTEENLLVDQETYLKAGVHIGTKFRTKFMAPYIYKTRPDGLSVLNLTEIDEGIKKAAEYLAQFPPEDILAVARRENGWKPLEKLAEHTGIKVQTGRYPPGMLTNPQLKKFMEPRVLVVCDAWPDANAVKDARQVKVPIVALCDTNNTTIGIDHVIPCNNKGKKSLALAYYLLTREYLKARGLIKSDDEFKAEVEEFTAL